MDATRQLIVILLLVITANVGPSMIIWVAAGVYLGACNRRGRVSQHHINKTYFPSTPDPPANFKLVYKFKTQDQRVLFKARRYARANVCRRGLTEKWLRGGKSPPLPRLARCSSASQTNSP
eukprot:1612519-Rhodomonas_salina.1